MAERWLTKFAEKITRQLDDHDRRLRGMERKPQLHKSSLHDGSIDEYSQKNLVSVIGKQFDGGHGVVVTSDPVPPVPSPAEVVAGPESIAVRVPGTFVDNAGLTDESIVAPTYFSRVEVHVSTDPEFSALFADTLQGSVESPRGGWLVVSPLPVQAHYVRLVTRSKSGKASAPSAVVEVTPRPKLQPGDIDGMHITGATFRTRGDGAGVIFSDDGIQVFNADGSTIVNLPSDGSPAQIDAELVARSLTVLGAMSVRGDDNEIASGGGFTLAAGVSAPSSPPNVSMTYPTIKLPAPPESRSSVHGIAYMGGLWWRSVNVWDTRADRLEGFNDAGELVETLPFTGGGPIHGLTSIGSILYVLVTTNGGRVFVYGLDPVAETVASSWEFTGNTGAGTPAIGTDGTNVVIAQCWPSGDVSWWTYDAQTGAVLADQWSSYQLDGDLVGVHIGVADHGAERVSITKANGTTEIFEPDGTQIPFGGWYSRNREEHVGMCWDGTNFRGLAASGRIVEYSNIDGLGGDTNDWWLFNTWIDELGQETTIGPATRFTLVRRATLTIGRTDVPAGAVTAGLYLARKSATPTLLEIHQIAQSPMTVRLPDIEGWEAGANPPAVNEIPDSLPGWLAAQRGIFHVYGDGSGAWGPLEFHADRTATIRYLDVLVNEPFTGVTFANGWGNYPGYNALVTEIVAPGRVLLAGMLQPGTAVADVRIGAVTDTDHMPKVKQFLPANINNGGSESFNPGVITVEPNGDLRLRGFPSTSNNGYVVVNAEYNV